MTLGTERLIGRVEPPVAWMIFNQPERRNAISMDMWEAMPSLLSALQTDPAIRLLVVTGAGDKAFAAGADISQFATLRSGAEPVAADNAASVAAQTALRDFPKPTIAMIRGFCMGGGMLLALLCDLRIAEEGARFGIPAARLGIGYGVEASRRLADLAGPAFAKEVLFTGRQFTAAEALAMGLLNKVVPSTELDKSVREYCDIIAANAPLSLTAAKLSVNAIGAESDAAGAAAAVAVCMASADYQEGQRAFLEKRKPKFQGK